ncbi:MAG TPA: glycosyltransferase [Pirellulales bacterium]|nr:glycosyltransferase [Pirellulales bacterium]
MLDACFARFGNKFCSVHGVRGRELTRLVRSFRLVVGPHVPHFTGYWSNRIYVVTGHGGLFAAPAVPGMSDEGWRPGVNYLELPLEPQAMAETLAEYLAADDEGWLESVRRAGFEHASGLCTYDVRVRELLQYLG